MRLISYSIITPKSNLSALCTYFIATQKEHSAPLSHVLRYCCSVCVSVCMYDICTPLQNFTVWYDYNHMDWRKHVIDTFVHDIMIYFN